MGQGLFNVEAPRSHSEAPQPLLFRWTSDQSNAGSLIDNTQDSQETIKPLQQNSNPQSLQASGHRSSP